LQKQNKKDCDERFLFLFYFFQKKRECVDKLYVQITSLLNKSLKTFVPFLPPAPVPK